MFCVSVSDMSQDHGGPLAPEDIKEEEVVAQSRKDAKLRYNQFRALSSTSNPGKRCQLAAFYGEGAVSWDRLPILQLRSY